MKTKNAFSLILNIAIVGFTAYAISLYFTTGGSANMQDFGWSCLRYFTNLSNIFVAFASLLMIPFNLRNIRTRRNYFPRAIYVIKFVATVSVTVTFLTVVFFLAPMAVASSSHGGDINWMAFFWFFQDGAFFLHFLTPVLAIISAIFLERSHGKITKKIAWLGLLPTVLYSGVYAYEVAYLGEAHGGWPDFYGFTFGGNLKYAACSIVAMYLFTYIISRIEIAIYKK